MQSINYKNFIINYWPCFLVVLAFFGFISKALYNYPIGVMSLIGLYITLSNPKILINDNTFKIFLVIFLCIWLPQVISLINAVNIEHSLKTVIPYLRFLFVGIFFLVFISKDKEKIDFIVKSIFFLIIFWTVDASIQFFYKKDIFGFPWESGHITGMFFPRNTISHICAILSSFLFLHVYNSINYKKTMLLSLVPLFFIILISGRRAAWIMLALTSFSFFIYGFTFYENKKFFLKIVSIAIIFISIIFGTVISSHQPLKTRIIATQGLFSNNYESFNVATAYRLPIWETAYAIFKENTVFGIGPRGFRHVYENYAKPDDIFVKNNVPPTQPHLLLLEIMCETGLVGLMGYFFALFFLFKFVLQQKTKKHLLPYFIPVAVALFPLNAHMAFYGSIWASIIWLLTSLCFAKAKNLV